MTERSFSRLPIHLEATISHNGAEVAGELDNLSMKGVLVRTDQLLPVDDTVTITIYHISRDNVICRLKGRVVRSTAEGVAIEFEKTFLD